MATLASSRAASTSSSRYSGRGQVLNKARLRPSAVSAFCPPDSSLVSLSGWLLIAICSSMPLLAKSSGSDRHSRAVHPSSKPGKISVK